MDRGEGDEARRLDDAIPEGRHPRPAGGHIEDQISTALIRLQPRIPTFDPGAGKRIGADKLEARFWPNPHSLALGRELGDDESGDNQGGESDAHVNEELWMPPQET